MLFLFIIFFQAGVDTALDALCHQCVNKLVYADKEKDMIVMRHTFEVFFVFF